jgi:two-component system, OmpR family, KDP operon response regulator KdpE
MARLRVALRHRSQISRNGVEQGVYEFEELSVNLAGRYATLSGKYLHLTPTEYRLLTVLVQNEGKVITHQQLLREVWGPGSQTESHYVRVYINQLRQKLNDNAVTPRFIMTVSGIGYRFGRI